MEIDALQLNLCMDSVYVKELLSVKWLCESGLVENIELVVEEYRQYRHLLVCKKERQTHKMASERNALLYKKKMSFISPAHSCVCSGSSCSGEKHSVQTHLSTLQTPLHHFERDHLTTGELPTTHIWCTFLWDFQWYFLPRKLLWTILMRMQKMKTL